MSQKESCSKQDWIRLQSLVKAVSTAQTRLVDCESKLHTSLDEETELQSHLSQLQNKKLLIKVRKNDLDRLRKRIRNFQHRLTVAFEEECQQADKRQEISRSIDNVQSQIEIVQKETQILRSSLVYLRNELIFRRRFMLADLYKIYFIDDYLIRYFKRTCSCTKYDVIAGIHLPAISERSDHSEAQVCGAISQLVNLLNCIARIVDVPLRNFLIFRGSNSVICSRATGERLNFYQTLTKGQKPKFDLCLKLLCENVTQFRSDCRLPTQANLPIASIREALLFCTGKYPVPFPREKPSDNFYCCSSLIPKLSPPPSTLTFSLNNLHLSEENNEKPSQSISIKKNSILEVISSTG
ncbi:hypothetical protein M3Y97_00256400 [Aphelenchoides bicaudatus]|nr:hypothetical protein M3Y97_00256400 [Aphelenchoides bicaudatus]